MTLAANCYQILLHSNSDKSYCLFCKALQVGHHVLIYEGLLFVPGVLSLFRTGSRFCSVREVHPPELAAPAPQLGLVLLYSISHFSMYFREVLWYDMGCQPSGAMPLCTSAAAQFSAALESHTSDDHCLDRKPNIFLCQLQSTRHNSVRITSALRYTQLVRLRIHCSSLASTVLPTSF